MLNYYLVYPQYEQTNTKHMYRIKGKIKQYSVLGIVSENEKKIMGDMSSMSYL